MPLHKKKKNSFSLRLDNLFMVFYIPKDCSLKHSLGNPFPKSQPSVICIHTLYIINLFLLHFNHKETDSITNKNVPQSID